MHRPDFKISVIITNYNYAKYIGQCIDSVLAQSYHNKQIIVVDDGSSDDSKTVIDEYKGAIEVIYKENGGQASAFNEGFKLALGKVVIFLDADDLLLPNALEEIADNWSPDYIKWHWRMRKIDGDGRDLGGFEPKAKWRLSVGEVTRMHLEEGTINPPTSGNAFNREMLASIMPVPDDFVISADSYLFARCPFLGRYAEIYRSLSCYRVHGKNNYSRKGGGEIVLIRKMLKRRILLGAFIEMDASAAGIKCKRGLIYRNYGTIRARLQSYCHPDAGHPINPDSVVKILCQCLIRVIHPGLTSRPRRLIEFSILALELFCRKLACAYYKNFSS